MGSSPSQPSANGNDPVVVTVVTGDIKRYTGTDNNVMIRFTDVQGKRTKDIQLDNVLKNDFKKGGTDTFNIDDLSDGVDGGLGEISFLEIWREKALFDDGLFLNLLTAERKKSKIKHIYPINRWIPMGNSLFLREYDAFLPQDDMFPDQRKKELDIKRQHYVLKESAAGIPPECDGLPEDERFSREQEFDLDSKILEYAIKSGWKEIKLTEPTKLDDLKKLHTKTFPLPEGAAKDWFLLDEYFGEQRIAGLNPCQIMLCTSIPANFAVTNEMVLPFLENRTLHSAMEEKRVFILDYEILKYIDKTDSEMQMVSPLALLYRNSEDHLVPIAIQLEQDPSETNPVFLPSDPKYTWLMAKLWCNLADASIHQPKAHLGFTHLLGESICVAMHRELSPSHPVFQLLAPHFLYVIAINSDALSILTPPGGFVDKSMSLGRKGLFDVIRRSRLTWRMDVDGNPTKDIERRGVGKDALPHYPYRDDAIPIFEAIHQYVSEIITGFYTADSLKKDHEIQSWYKLLSSPVELGGAGIEGVPGDGQTATLEDIVSIASSIIFTMSVQHAAVNFLQYEQYGFPPIYPGLLRGRAPTNKTMVLEEADCLEALPSLSQATVIMMLVRILAERNTDALGYFEIQYGYHPTAVSALETFRRNLKEIGKDTRSRNARRKYSYDILDPEQIPNAVSI